MKFARSIAVLSLVVCLLAFSACSTFVQSQTSVQTPLSSLVDNNTSAANTFQSQSNGNVGANNVSKVDVHKLLYPGASTKVLAHYLPWFGKSNHMNVGYSSIDPVEVHNQINDMVSRGIDGVLVDWYGSGTYEDQSTKLVMAEAEAHPGFTFAIMIDKGAIKQYSCTGCSPQNGLINQLQYVEQTYFPSSAYMKIGGVPVVTDFGIQYAYTIDWNAVSAALSTHPAFLYQNNDAFTRSPTDGGYAWIMPTTTDYGMAYLDSFYRLGLSYPNEKTVGAVYKGFDDGLSLWGSHRVMSQQCGQTWLQTFAKINSLYSAGKQLPYLQLVTWNDYEEGSEIESGIDPCFGLAASVSGNTLSWAIGGNENVVDHYSVFDSLNGVSLTKLHDALPGNRSLDLCNYSLASGTHQLYVQEVSKSSFANRLAPAVQYTSSCVPPQVTITAQSAVTIPANGSAAFTINATSTYRVPMTLVCTTRPNSVTCSVKQ